MFLGRWNYYLVRCIDLESHIIRSMDFDECTHNNKGFCEKFIFSKSVKRDNNCNKGDHEILVENSHLSFHPLMATSVKENIQLSYDCVNIAKIWTLE